jgi:hypothetical protein
MHDIEGDVHLQRLKVNVPFNVECRMATVYYVLAGILLYLAADWLLRRIEARAGRILEYRTLLFFGLLASMTLISFALIRMLLER